MDNGTKCVENEMCCAPRYEKKLARLLLMNINIPGNNAMYSCSGARRGLGVAWKAGRKEDCKLLFGNLLYIMGEYLFHIVYIFSSCQTVETFIPIPSMG